MFFLFLHSRESFDAGITPGLCKSLTFVNATVVIELKELYGGFTHWVRRVDANAIQLKAKAPTICAWMKQSE